MDAYEGGHLIRVTPKNRKRVHTGRGLKRDTEIQVGGVSVDKKRR